MKIAKQVSLATAVLVLALILLGFLIGRATAVKPEKEPRGANKVTICHATESETNPWVRTVVDEHATAGHFDNNGTALAGHEDDKLLEGDVDCPPVEETKPPENNPETEAVNTPEPDTSVSAERLNTVPIEGK